jgi:hypothetical protein
LELDTNKSIDIKRYLRGNRKKIEEFLIDESLIINGSELIDMALGATIIELESKEILGIS